jgi:hypothetical protein
MSSDVGYGKPPVEHQFQTGQSGNPAGRPKGFARRIREAVGDDGERLIEFWVSAVRDGYIVHRHPETGEQTYEKVSVRDQIAISTILADRGWGKAPQYVVIEDEGPPRNPVVDAERFGDELQRRLDELAEIRKRRLLEKGSGSE